MENKYMLQVEDFGAPDQSGQKKLIRLDGIDEFKSELSTDFAVIVHERPDGLGGLYGISINLLSPETLGGIAIGVGSNIVYNLLLKSIKLMAKGLNRLFERNKDKDWTSNVRLEKLCLTFQDGVIYIYQIGPNSILYSIEKIMNIICENYGKLKADNEFPFSIHIPVFKDDSSEKVKNYRTALSVDETIVNMDERDYFIYWGLMYDYLGSSKVFDVKRGVIIDEEFVDENQYWGLKGL